MDHGGGVARRRGRSDGRRGPPGGRPHRPPDQRTGRWRGAPAARVGSPLAMLVVGVVAAMVSDRWTAWLLPAGFVAGMVAGGLVDVAGVAFPDRARRCGIGAPARLAVSGAVGTARRWFRRWHCSSAPPAWPTAVSCPPARRRGLSRWFRGGHGGAPRRRRRSWDRAADPPGFAPPGGCHGGHRPPPRPELTSPSPTAHCAGGSGAHRTHGVRQPPTRLGWAGASAAAVGGLALWAPWPPREWRPRRRRPGWSLALTGES